jgi:hypothetical protein
LERAVAFATPLNPTKLEHIISTTIHKVFEMEFGCPFTIRELEPKFICEPTQNGNTSNLYISIFSTS